MSKFPPPLIAAVKASQQATGAPACVVLAQWAIESAWGTEVTGDFNYFGEKWVPECPYPFKECPTEEEINGKDVPEVDKFVSFPSMEAAIVFQGRALTDPHGPYGKALPFIKNWRGWLHMISRIYSSDSHYEALITEIISENNLESI